MTEKEILEKRLKEVFVGYNEMPSLTFEALASFIIDLGYVRSPAVNFKEGVRNTVYLINERVANKLKENRGNFSEINLWEVLDSIKRDYLGDSE